MSHAQAFYISISTEPNPPGEDTFGCGTFAVLRGAPSREAAEGWAEDFARRMILDSRKDQRLAEIRIVPLSDRLLSLSGFEAIDWEQLNLDARKSANDPAHRDCLCSVGGMDLSSVDRTSPLPDGWDRPERLKELLPKEHSDQMNWDESRPGFYIFHDRSKGIVIRAANSFVATIPFTNHNDADFPRGPQILMDWFPGIEIYIK